ncbi:MAG: acyltransferase [Bacteroidales bacterium]|nr:acyltransferase [Bacteroidales bacterium]
MIFFRLIRYLFSQTKKGFQYYYNRVLFYICHIDCGKNCKINGRLYISNCGKIQIGNAFRANSGKMANPIGGDTVLRLVVGQGAVLIIGNNVGISNSTIVCKNRVEIGHYVYIGGSCKLWDTDFHNLDPIDRMHNGDKNVKTAPIRICDYAFIGGSSIILKGVTIGKNSIVAAGSIVTKSIPDNEIWGGNPAKYLRRNNG